MIARARRVGVPRLALQDRLRDLLHADRLAGQARGQVDHRRRVRSPRRRGRWRADPAAASCCRAHRSTPALMGAAIGCSAVAVAVAQRLSRGYIHTLERSLLESCRGARPVGRRRHHHPNGHDADDSRTATEHPAAGHGDASAGQRHATQGEATTRFATPVADPEVQEILALRSRNRTACSRCCARRKGCRPRSFRT